MYVLSSGAYCRMTQCQQCTKVLVFSVSLPEVKGIIGFNFCKFGKRHPTLFAVLIYASDG